MVRAPRSCQRFATAIDNRKSPPASPANRHSVSDLGAVPRSIRRGRVRTADHSLISRSEDARRGTKIRASAGQHRSREPSGRIDLGVSVCGRRARKIPVGKRQRCERRDRSVCNRRKGEGFPAFGIADRMLIEPFSAPGSAGKMVDLTRVVGQLVQVRYGRSAFRAWTGLRQHGPRRRGRSRTPLLQFRRWRSGRERGRQRGVRHRAQGNKVPSRRLPSPGPSHLAHRLQ